MGQRLQFDAVDLDRLSAAIGTSRPADPFDLDEVAAWLGANGPELIPPSLFDSGLVAGDQSAVHDELGFVLGELDAVSSWTADGGTFYWEFIGPVEVADSADDLGDGLLSIGPGEDFQLNFGAASELRPQGMPLRLANLDDGVVMSMDSASVTDRLAAGADRPVADWPSSLAELGEAATRSDPFVLVILAGDLSIRSDEIAPEPPPGLHWFGPTACAIGFVVDEGIAINVSYQFSSPAAASAALPVVETLGTAGWSWIFGAAQNWSDSISVDSVSVDGSIVEVVLRPLDDRAYGLVWQRIRSGDFPFAGPLR